MNLKITAWIVTAIALASLLGWGLKTARDDGRDAERAVWVEAQAEAAAQQRRAERASTAASEAVADSTRQAATATITETRAESATAAERITYVYRTLPAPACAPEPIPAGVRDELREARGALAAAKD